MNRALNYTATGLQHNPSPPDEDETVADILAAYRQDPVRIAEADERWSGTLDGGTYSDIESALADFWAVDVERLLGSDAMHRVMRLAFACHTARDERLQEMAEEAAAEMGAE